MKRSADTNIDYRINLKIKELISKQLIYLRHKSKLITNRPNVRVS
jgi:hypothetical protein